MTTQNRKTTKTILVGPPRSRLGSLMNLMHRVVVDELPALDGSVLALSGQGIMPGLYRLTLTGSRTPPFHGDDVQLPYYEAERIDDIPNGKDTHIAHSYNN